MKKPYWYFLGNSYGHKEHKGFLEDMKIVNSIIERTKGGNFSESELNTALDIIDTIELLRTAMKRRISKKNRLYCSHLKVMKEK